MLPLDSTGLSTEDEWHLLKDTLVVCRYWKPAAAQRVFDELPVHLQVHPIGVAVLSFLTSGDICQLDAAATNLTQRSIPDAWTLLERL